MKDIQGYDRGKCNSCECQEYREPPNDSDESPDKPRRLRCEYCNHTPVEHVWIIKLGECRKCGEDNCDKYESEDKNSYTDCGYCGCSASDHKGAQKLRNPTTKPTAAAAVTPCSDPSGQPVQSSQYGLCNFPGCSYPKRSGHDYCSQTCARKGTSFASFGVSTAAKESSSGSDRGQGSGSVQCTSCSKPANPGHKLCSSCYTTYYRAQKKS